MQNIFKKRTEELLKALNSGSLETWHQQIETVSMQIKEAFSKGKKVYVAGNGGSATLAQHLSDEMVGRYIANRPAYPVIALTSDSAVITCIGNDYGYDEIFKRQIEALGREGDVFIAYSTSGNSKNILLACEQARNQGMTVVAFTGKSGQLKDIADYAVISPASFAPHIQELDLHALHLICEAFEPANFANNL